MQCLEVLLAGAPKIREGCVASPFRLAAQLPPKPRTFRLAAQLPPKPRTSCRSQATGSRNGNGKVEMEKIHKSETNLL